MDTKSIWKIILKDQLDITESLDKEVISKLKGNPLYGEYKTGEKILYFLLYVKKHEYEIKSFAYPSGFHDFVTDLCFIRMTSKYPVCIKMENDYTEKEGIKIWGKKPFKSGRLKYV